MENQDTKKRVLSGIRATGNLHLGNYYGALSKFVRMQDDYDCRFFIADLHALTTHPDPKMLHENVKQILAEYIAAGLSVKKLQRVFEKIGSILLAQLFAAVDFKKVFYRHAFKIHN